MAIIKTEDLNCKVNPKLKEKIRDTSNLMGISISEFIRYSLVQAINGLDESFKENREVREASRK